MDPVNPDADLQGPNLDPEVPHAEERSPAGREPEANRGGKGGNWDEDRSETYRAHGAVAGGVAGFTATDEGSHAYPMTGTYDLKVTARDNDGGTCEMIAHIFV